MKSILVPTDFSKCAANAMTIALKLSRETEAEVTVIHVVYPNEGVDNNMYNVFWSDQYMSEREKGLNTWIHKFRRDKENKKIKINTECRVGFPVPTICDVAAEIHADIIVMGTTGATGLRGTLLGSVAAGVMARTRHPLLSIPKKATFTNTENAVFATDFKLKLDTPSLDLLIELLRLKKSTLHFVHILDKPGMELDKAREKSISQKFGTIPHDFHYLHDRDITQAISNFLEASNAGLLVAVAHEHSLFHRLFYESITRRLAHRIGLPMLTLHDATI